MYSTKFYFLIEKTRIKYLFLCAKSVFKIQIKLSLDPLSNFYHITNNSNNNNTKQQTTTMSSSNNNTVDHQQIKSAIKFIQKTNPSKCGSLEDIFQLRSLFSLSSVGKCLQISQLVETKLKFKGESIYKSLNHGKWSS